MARPRSRTDADVFAAVWRVVGARGVAGLTLAAVGREAGLAASTLAERFGSKRALLLAAAHAAAAPAVVFGSGPPLAALIDGLVALGAGVGDRTAFAHHLSVLALDVADPEFRAIAAGHAAALQTAIAAQLSGADLPPSTDLHALARRIHVTYNGALLLWAIAGEAPLAATLRADLTSCLAQTGV